MPARVAFLGLGAMGRGMAGRLAAHLSSGGAPDLGGELLVWNRSHAAAVAFAGATPGARAAESLAAVAAEAPAVVLSCLSNDAALEQVLVGYLEARHGAGGAAAQAPCVFVSTTTVLPQTVARLSPLAAAAGVALLNCAVFGRPDAAAAGSLVAVPAGPPDARAALEPLLPAFAGRGVWDLGDDPAASAALKLVGNYWIVSQIELQAELLALANKNGIADGAVLRMLETFLTSPIPMGYANRMSAGDYSTETGFSVDLALKDVGHIRSLAAAAACPAPLADIAFNHLLHAKAKHGGELDWGAIHLAVRDSAGLPPNAQGGGA